MKTQIIRRLDWSCTPLDLACAWPANRPLLMLHSGRLQRRWSRWSILASPRGWFRSARGESSLEGATPRLAQRLLNDPLADLDMLLSASREAAAWDAAVPFVGGWIGFFSYDLGRLIEPAARHGGPAARRDRGWPEIELAWCPDAFLCDHLAGCWWAVGSPDKIELADCVHSRSGGDSMNAPRTGPLRSSWSDSAYLHGVERAIEYIRAGDIYQASITRRFSCHFAGSTRMLWQSAAAFSRPWYGAYLELPGGLCILSQSPELFLQLDGADRSVLTRPIKGTRPSRAARESLRRSEKDTAELHMIVDLMRNDLGRVCEFGTVRVEQARQIETHPTVHHGVAEIAGRLRCDRNFCDLLRATFPGGSVTGAPKIRAMQIIDELEPVRRGPYCGSMGMIDRRGTAVLNIAIRTIAISGQRTAGRFDCFEEGVLDYGAGGGIVADSVPRNELEETWTKTAVLRAALRCGSAGADRLGTRRLAPRRNDQSAYASEPLSVRAVTTGETCGVIPPLTPTSAPTAPAEHRQRTG